MGNSFSTRRPRILIGDLSTLSPTEHKLYSLSHAVLDSEDPRIGQVPHSIGVKILGRKTLCDEQTKSQTDIDSTRKKDKDSKCIDSCEVTLDETTPAGTQNGFDVGTTSNQHNVGLMSDQHQTNAKCSDETTGTSSVTELFNLLITDKPYWFSQSFSQWKAFSQYDNMFSCCHPEKYAIYIAPIDNFPPFIKDYEIKLDSYRQCLNFNSLLQTFAEAFFDCDSVRLLPAVNLLASKWNIKTRLHKKTKQKQYFVRDFHVNLKKLKPADGICIMGFSWTDLYPTEDLNFVLGEANFTTKSAIFCFGRYEPKSYDPETHSDITEVDAKLLWRILKVFSHELCHLLGLQHCWYFDCAMNESNSMAAAFHQPLFLCPVCLRKLQHALGFNVVRRYQRLKQFLSDISVHYPSREFKHAVNWLEIMLTYLNDDSDTRYS